MFGVFYLSLCVDCFDNANYLQNVLTFSVALKYKNAVRLQIKNANCLQNVPVRRECRCFAGSCVKVLSNSIYC